ncbi:unnamed protein product [Clonostachys rosea]|uniref:MYND-type domain-containing protein n=1 Tax=Bionectria ochroleuca TaxID=29856 RepID=A0ABY6U2G4_BIOOC|nr:unnamed protein product [Clonostachys rosea]
MATGSGIPENHDGLNAWFQGFGLPAIPQNKPGPTITSINGPSSLPYDSMTDHQKCANCGKGGCTLACSRCNITDVGHLRVPYCSKECQTADWKSHQKVCRSRQLLARGVSVLVGLWTVLQSSTYAHRCDFSPEDNGIIAVEEWEPDQDRRCYTGASFFRRFPDDVIPANMGAKAKKAVLFGRGGKGITSVGMPWVKTFLQPFCTKIEEIDIHIKNPALVFQTGELKDTEHDVLRITTKTGEDVFSRYRIHTTLLECAIGNQMKRAAMDASMLDPISGAVFQYKARESLVIRISEGTDRAIASFPGGIESWMLSRQPHLFEDFKRQIIARAKRFINDAIPTLYRLGIGRQFFVHPVDDNHFFPATTPNPGYAELLKKVWFTEAEVNAFKDDQSLKEAWVSRMIKLRDDPLWRQFATESFSGQVKCSILEHIGEIID